MKHVEYVINEETSRETIIIPIPESYKDCIKLIKSDYFRRSGKIVSIWKIFLKIFLNPCIATQFWARISAYEKKSLLYYISKFFLRHYRLRYGISFNTKRVGYGLYIGHEYLRVSKYAIIGNNVNLSQFSTIGSNSDVGAIIGNNVYIGPNVCIVDDVNIGSNVTIGAGTIIVKDLFANGTYVGNPARRVGDNKHPEYIRNPWINIK